MWPILIGLHILAATVWVGGLFFALVVLRPSLAVLEPPQRLLFHGQIFRRFALVIWHAMPIALGTGYALLFGWFGGFRGVPWTIHLMHLAGLLMACVYLAMFFGPYRKFRDSPGPESVRAIRNLLAVNLALGLVTIGLAAAGRYGW